MSEMGNEFSGLPIGELIGSPLTAACDAQVKLAMATANFITTVGFHPETKQTRQVDFSFWRPARGGGGSGDGAAGEAMVEKVTLSVPFLAIVNVPALKVKSVDIVFDMEVKSAETSKDSLNVTAGLEVSGGGGFGPVNFSAKVTGSVSTAKEHTRSTDKSAKYHVEVHALDEGMPEGLSRVLDILQSAIAPVSVGKSEKAAPGQALPLSAQSASGDASTPAADPNATPATDPNATLAADSGSTQA